MKKLNRKQGILLSSLQDIIERMIWQGNIIIAINKEEKSLLLANHAKGLLSSSGKYIIAEDIFENFKELAAVVLHEDIEKLMILINKTDKSRYFSIKDIMLHNRTIHLYSMIFNGNVPVECDAMVADMVAKAFELAFSVAFIKRKVTLSELKYLKHISPKMQDGNLFGRLFWNQNIRNAYFEENNKALGMALAQLQNSFLRGTSRPFNDPYVLMDRDPDYGRDPDPDPVETSYNTYTSYTSEDIKKDALTEIKRLLLEKNNDLKIQNWMRNYEQYNWFQEEFAQIFTQNYLSILLKALEDGSSNIRNSAAEALKKMNEFTVERKAKFYAFSGYVKRCVKLGNIAVPVLLEALAKSNVRVSAARALGEIGDKRAVPVLLEALKDQDSNVRAEAATALEKMHEFSVEKKAIFYAFNGDVENYRKLGYNAVPLLIEALKDSQFRQTAATALGSISDKSVVQGLIELLKDDDSVIRQIAESLLDKPEFQFNKYYFDPYVINILKMTIHGVNFKIDMYSRRELKWFAKHLKQSHNYSIFDEGIVLFKYFIKTIFN